MYFCLDPCERTCTGASRQSCEVWRLSRMQYQLARCCVVVLRHAGGARRNPQGERYLSRFRGRRLYVRYDSTKIVSSSSSSTLLRFSPSAALKLARRDAQARRAQY